METPVWGLSRPTPAVGLAVTDLPTGSHNEVAALRRIGRVVAKRYQLTAVVGAGSAGAVYRATDMQRKQDVAVKLLHERLDSESESRQRFAREMQAAVTVHHPNIVRLLDRGEEPDGTPFLVLELLEGRGLDVALEAGPMDVPSAVEVTRQLLSALAAVHFHGYLHRDVTPENVFLTRGYDDELHVKLIDFGISKPVKTDMTITGDGIILGTPSYMAPEQITSDYDFTPATDVWQAGAVLYTMLTGGPPFHDDNLSRLLVQIARTSAPPIANFRSDCPDSIAEVLTKSLRRVPQQRYSNGHDMSVALHRAAHAAGL